jgi:hypothetical protein
MFSFFWTSILAFHLFLTVAMNKDRLSRRLMPVYHIVSWSVGLLITSAVCGVELLGPGGSEDSVAWCFIDKNSSRNSTTLALEFLAGKFWEIMAYILTGVFYTLLVIALYKRKRKEFSAPQLRLEWKLALVPILFILVRFWGTLRFLLAFKGTNSVQNTQVLVILQAIGDGAQGWVNGILFVLLNSKAMQVYEKICCLYCNRKKDTWDRLLQGDGDSQRAEGVDTSGNLEDDSARLIHPSSRHANLYYGSTESEVNRLKAVKPRKKITSSDAFSTPVPSDNELLQ